MMKLLALALLCVLVSGCANDPIQTAVVGKDGEMKVGLLFQHKGVSVYRFYDAGHFHYYAVQGDDRVVVSGTYQCGKNATCIEPITTLGAK
jgi:hypothetical protein